MWVVDGEINQTVYGVTSGVDDDWLLVILCQGGAILLGIFTISLGFCGQIFLWLHRFPLKNSLARSWLICFSETACYQNSTVFWFFMTKDKKLTSCTQTNCWLDLRIFTTNTGQPSRQILQLSKTQPLLQRQIIAKIVICFTKSENQWSVPYLKVQIYNNN